MYVGKVALSPLKSQTTFGYGGLLVGGTNSTFCKKNSYKKKIPVQLLQDGTMYFYQFINLIYSFI